MSDYRSDQEIELPPELVEQIKEILDKEENYHEAYEAIGDYLETVEADADRQFWFEQATHINAYANGLPVKAKDDSAAVFVVATTSFGLQANDRQADITETTNEIAKNVLQGIALDGKVPSFDAMLKEDIAAALDPYSGLLANAEPGSVAGKDLGETGSRSVPAFPNLPLGKESTYTNSYEITGQQGPLSFTVTMDVDTGYQSGGSMYAGIQQLLPVSSASLQAAYNGVPLDADQAVIAADIMNEMPEDLLPEEKAIALEQALIERGVLEPVGGGNMAVAGKPTTFGYVAEGYLRGGYKDIRKDGGSAFRKDR